MDIAVLIGGTGLLLGLFYYVNTRVSGQVTRVRTAVLAAAPELDCSVGTYSGNGSGLHAAIKNSGQVRAFELALGFPTMGVVWTQAHLERGDWARPHIPIADEAPLRTTRLTDPAAILSYKDRFGLVYELQIPLTQTPRDDGRFNLGSTTGVRKLKPALTGRQMWRLRKHV